MFTICIAIVGCQYLHYLFYRRIYLLRFIFCCFGLIYKRYIIVLSFICNRHRNLNFSQISNQFFCDIFGHNFSLQTSKSNTFQNIQSPTHIKHWKTDIYWGSTDRNEGYPDSDLNCLASVILIQYTNVTNQC